MPPRAKFSREEIIEAAFNIVRADGPLALTARALGLKLGSSARPVFTVFNSMEEVQQEVAAKARALYGAYIEKGLSETPAFKGTGEQYILFSIKEPKLFQLLFMAEKEAVPELSEVLPLIDDNYEKILLSIQNDYGMRVELSKRLYHHLWIYTHGIATLCATKMCSFTVEEINAMMTEVGKSLLNNMKAGGDND